MRTRALLTGAGFTKGFGGFLAAEFWSLLLNSPEVQESPLQLRLRLKTGPEPFDFEQLYADLEPSHKETMTEVLRRVYGLQEAQIFSKYFRHPANRSNNLFEFFRLFSTEAEVEAVTFSR